MSLFVFGDDLLQFFRIHFLKPAVLSDEYSGALNVLGPRLVRHKTIEPDFHKSFG